MTALSSNWNVNTGQACLIKGVAGPAIDAILELVKTKTPAFTETSLRDQPVAQHAIGRAASKVNPGRDTLYAAAEETFS